MRLPIITALCLSVMGSPGALAQSQPPPVPPPVAPPSPEVPPPPAERSGPMFTGGLGVGSFGLQVDGESVDDESYEGFSYALGFGGLLSPRMAVGVEVAGTRSPQTDNDPGGGLDFTIYQRNISGWFRYWVSSRWWLQGGLGSARAGISSEFDDPPPIKGLALSAAGGFEMLRGPDWAIDVQLRVNTVDYKDDPDLSENVTSSGIALLISYAHF